MGRAQWRTFARYTAFQAPGWALVGLALYAFVAWGWLERGVALVLGLLYVAKDLALFPWLRLAYEAGDPSPSAALLGKSGVARERLDPRGYVQLGAELWRAELAPGCAPIEPGGHVRVRAVHGLTLIVESE